MFDIGFTEMMLLIAIVVIVVGPKDLPKVMRSVGGWVRKARGMAREFQGGIEQIARESELDELRKGAEQLKNFDPNAHLEKSIDPTGELRSNISSPIPSSSPAKGGDGGGSIGALSDGPTPPKVTSDTPNEKKGD